MVFVLDFSSKLHVVDNLRMNSQCRTYKMLFCARMIDFCKYCQQSAMAYQRYSQKVAAKYTSNLSRNNLCPVHLANEIAPAVGECGLSNKLANCL